MEEGWWKEGVIRGTYRTAENSIFFGVFDLETLQSPQQVECGIVNLNMSVLNHWVCYWKNGDERIFFDPLAQVTPVKI